MFPVKLTNRIFRDIQIEIYYERLAHTTMEAEKSYNLPSVSWRPRKASGAVSGPTPRPKNQGSQWCKSQSRSKALRTRSTDVQRWGRWMSPLKQRKFTLPLLFRAIQALNKWGDAHPRWWEQWSSLLNLLIPMLMSSGNTLTDTSRNTSS